jgi:hypothetical protein
MAYVVLLVSISVCEKHVRGKTRHHAYEVRGPREGG